MSRPSQEFEPLLTPGIPISQDIGSSRFSLNRVLNIVKAMMPTVAIEVVWAGMSAELPSLVREAGGVAFLGVGAGMYVSNFHSKALDFAIGSVGLGILLASEQIPITDERSLIMVGVAKGVAMGFAVASGASGIRKLMGLVS